MTPHIAAKAKDIAKIVLMPGDPLRAKWMTETFLKDFKCVNEVRGMLGFTGKYKNQRITIMGHGMGIPSIGIYSHELMHFYNVDTIIRVGSCGALQKNLNLGDLIIAEDCFSESVYAKLIQVPVENKKIKASDNLVKLAEDTSKKLNVKAYKGTVISEDAFYQTLYKPQDLVKKHNALCVEMEAFALYANAIKNKKQALTLLTVSDSLVENKQMSAQMRQSSFKDMTFLALEMSINLLKRKK